MRVLFFARHFSYLRNFESVLRLLAAHGHQVHIAVEREVTTQGGREMVDRLAQECPSITAGFSPERTDGWYRIATKLRLGLDYLRYLEPAYAAAPRLASRARERAPHVVVAIADSAIGRSPSGRRVLARLLWAMEQAVPISEEVTRFIDEQAPDAVLMTPLIGVVASPQLDYLYAARYRRRPTALCVWSWDHLSSKALIRTVPDRVLVWNPTQKDEAVTLHGAPADRVVVTGAQCFDQWFDRAPSRSRAEFCRRVGLPDDRRFLLWVCSALFKGSPVEAEFVARWIAALRASGHPELKDCGILVRPHPSRMAEWEGVDWQRFPNVAFWGANPVDADARADYFDSLAFSAAVAGLNTSAFIEGGIAGRPIYAILPPEYYDNQEGTIHFRYLMTVAGGLLNVGRSFEEHAAQLAASLRGEVPDPDRSRRFVEAFVRPQGLGRPSSPIFAEAVEALPAVGAQAAPGRAGLLARTALRLLRRFGASRIGHDWMVLEHVYLKEQQSRAARASKQAWRARRGVERAARMDVKQRKADADALVKQRKMEAKAQAREQAGKVSTGR